MVNIFFLLASVICFEFHQIRNIHQLVGQMFKSILSLYEWICMNIYLLQLLFEDWISSVFKSIFPYFHLVWWWNTTHIAEDVDYLPAKWDQPEILKLKGR